MWQRRIRPSSCTFQEKKTQGKDTIENNRRSPRHGFCIVSYSSPCRYPSETGRASYCTNAAELTNIDQTVNRGRRVPQICFLLLPWLVVAVLIVSMGREETILERYTCFGGMTDRYNKGRA